MASSEAQRISIAFSLLTLVLALLVAQETAQGRGQGYVTWPGTVQAMELANIR